jgi:hypothetical protein
LNYTHTVRFINIISACAVFVCAATTSCTALSMQFDFAATTSCTALSMAFVCAGKLAFDSATKPFTVHSFYQNLV